MDLLDHLQRYITKQIALHKALFAKYPDIQATDNCAFRFPKSGFVIADDDYWEFFVHGSGVRFEQPASGAIVDIHNELAKAPDGVDYWRLVGYLDSIGVKEVTYRGASYLVDDEVIKRLLLDLIQVGELHPHPKSSQLFSLRSPAPAAR